jgi:hypothetical protein
MNPSSLIGLHGPAVSSAFHATVETTAVMFLERWIMWALGWSALVHRLYRQHN